MTSRRVAVIGGGIFGATAAIRLARKGHKVELFEKNEDLLMAASGINQYRLHRGYHYPRSLETAISCRDDLESFCSEYNDAVLDQFEHYFAISHFGSLVSASQYLKFLDQAGLEYKFEKPDFLKHEALDTCVRVSESLFDLSILRKIVRRKLHNNGVNVLLDREVYPKDVAAYDFVVVSTYSALNNFLIEEVPEAVQYYQFEICEKPVLRLPPHLMNKSVVIMDGPFMCINPMGTTDLSVMGHVVHAIHHSNVGIRPVIPAHLKPYLEAGVVSRPPVTKIDKFIEAASQYFHGIEKAEHFDSMFTIRTVLPGADDTDARPTLVKRVSDRIITVLSGKIGTCVHAADQVVGLVE